MAIEGALASLIEGKGGRGREGGMEGEARREERTREVQHAARGPSMVSTLFTISSWRLLKRHGAGKAPESAFSFMFV